MVLKRKAKSAKTSSTSHTRPRSWPQIPWRRVADISLALAVVIVAGYLVMFAVEVVSGYSQTREVPNRVVKLQIVNASGEHGLGSKVRSRLAELSDMELTVEVVEMSFFDLRQVARTVIVSRETDTEPARMLCERLGLNPNDVEYKQLEQNRESVTASLILGLDARDLLLKEPSEEEKT